MAKLQKVGCAVELGPALCEAVICADTEDRVRPVRSYAQTDLDMPSDQQKRDHGTMIIWKLGLGAARETVPVQDSARHNHDLPHTRHK